MLSRIFTALVVLACCTSTLSAQITTTTNQIKLTDGAGHSLLIKPPTTWTGLGTFEWVLPQPPVSAPPAGFVEVGSATLTSLQWDDVTKYWKAVAGGSGGTVNADILALPTTTSSVGQITSNGDRFMHSYGANNTFLGQNAGNFVMTGSNNTGLGRFALMSNTSGFNSTAVGTNSLVSSSTGFGNTAVGTSALQASTSGSNNVAIGEQALASLLTGSQNTAVGTSTAVSSTALSNTTTLGYQATATQDNQVVLGNTSVTLIQSTGGLLLNGTTGTTPTSGAGARMMWIPAKAAFRAGQVNGTQWDNAEIGGRSVAFGLNNRATGFDASAFGQATNATGFVSTTFGTLTTASGQYSLAAGYATNATGTGSVAMGRSTLASGDFSMAVGVQTTSSGANSIALGNMASTNGLAGTFFFGDNTNVGMVSNTAANQFLVRSTGGFQVVTVASASSPDFGIIGGSLLLNGTTGTTPTSGAGTRMMWIPAKKAFRAGEVTGAQWNDALIGQYSFAAGSNSTASGVMAVALGQNLTASGDNTTLFGESSTATASFAFAAGQFAHATGSYSRAFGNGVTASGSNSTAIGQSVTSSGDNSIALGKSAHTNGNAGSFIFGDGSVGITNNTAPNQFVVRASGGTIFWSNVISTVGVELAAGGNAWASISDSNRKANRLNIDGDDVLNKLSNIWMGSWNYKSQDVSTRHYGPMAQEFFAAFGNDGLGIIGNDTTLATADVDGVTLIAVKALIERNDTLESRVEALEGVIRRLAVERETLIHRTMMK